MKQKLLRTGNSLAVVVPAVFAKHMGLKAGDDVDVLFDAHKNQVIYTFKGIMQLPLSFQKKT